MTKKKQAKKVTVKQGPSLSKKRGAKASRFSFKGVPKDGRFVIEKDGVLYNKKGIQLTQKQALSNKQKIYRVDAKGKVIVPFKVDFSKVSGLPSQLPTYYYVKKLYKGKDPKLRHTYFYYDKNGNEVSEEKVRRSKRKVFFEDASGNIAKRKGSAKKVGKKVSSGTVLKTQIFAYDVIKKVTDNLSKKRKNFFTLKGNSYEVSDASAPIFLLAFSEINGEFLSIFKNIIASPILLIGYVEFKKNSIFDFSELTFEVAGGDMEGMEEEDFSEDEDLAPEIKRAMKTFRAFVTRKLKEYFSI